MSSRNEENVRINEQIRRKLKNYPAIILEYYEHLIASGKAYSTAKSYIETLLSFVDYMYAGMHTEDFFTKISSQNIYSYLEAGTEKNTNEETRMNYSSANAGKWSALHSFFAYLIPLHIMYNPVDGVQRPSLQRVKEMVYLTDDELKCIFSAARFAGRPMIVNRDLTILMLTCYRGLSTSEIQNLDIEDMDLASNKLWINGKNGYDEVHLTKQIVDQMKLWLMDRTRYYDDTSSNAVFLSQRKTRMSADSIGDVTKRYAEGINKQISPQTMRNTCVISLYKQTGDIHLCAKYLKHKNISTTYRYIEQLTQNEAGDIDKALAIMEDMIPSQYYEENTAKSDTLVTFSDKCRQLRRIRKEIADLNGIDFPMAECSNSQACTGRCSLSEMEINYLNAEINKKAVAGEHINVADISMDAIMEGCYAISSVANYSERSGQLSLF